MHNQKFMLLLQQVIDGIDFQIQRETQRFLLRKPIKNRLTVSTQALQCGILDDEA